MSRERLLVMKKVIVYGLGEEYSFLAEYLGKNYEIVGYSDSNIEKNSALELFVEPKNIKKLQCDYVIVTSHKYYHEIKDSLSERYEIDENKIVEPQDLISTQERYPIIVIKYVGGMGNLLFFYALQKEMEWRYPCIPVKADLTWYYTCGGSNFFMTPWIFELLFNEKLPIADTEEILMAKAHGFFCEKEHGKYDSSIWNKGSGYYQGYWQSSKYFNDVSNRLKEKLVNINCCFFTNRQKKILEQIQTTESVALWVRRGDYYATQKNKEIYGNICTEEYYVKAISFIKEHYSNAEFFVFSNDEEYARKMYGNMNVVSCKGVQEINEINMYLMSQCKHVIQSHSSFSWWAAWLHGTNGTIIVPSKWTNVSACEDLYESNWIRL